jgi:polyadenylate-binding protein
MDTGGTYMISAEQADAQQLQQQQYQAAAAAAQPRVPAQAQQQPPPTAAAPPQGPQTAQPGTARQQQQPPPQQRPHHQHPSQQPPQAQQQASQDTARELASQLANTTDPDEQQRLLGETLYPLVEAETSQLRAPKVTGMLLEGIEQAEILNLIETPQDLREKVQEAIQVLEQSEQ